MADPNARIFAYMAKQSIPKEERSELLQAINHPQKPEGLRPTVIIKHCADTAYTSITQCVLDLYRTYEEQYQQRQAKSRRQRKQAEADGRASLEATLGEDANAAVTGYTKLRIGRGAIIYTPKVTCKDE